ncbi:hypothetical protein LCGC14_3084240 [marine sediment metagenome]|uniref:Uncharacterized protein n=1 Tax=marine sediment metagenome TaxID=412755 RepID=A0A0F8V7D5_9ZZZZ
MTDNNKPITYAKVGGPPHYWDNLKIFDVNTGKEIKDVIEVDYNEDRCTCYRRIDGKLVVDPKDDYIERVYLKGKFRIERITNSNKDKKDD